MVVNWRHLWHPNSKQDRPVPQRCILISQLETVRTRYPDCNLPNESRGKTDYEMDSKNVWSLRRDWWFPWIVHSDLWGLHSVEKKAGSVIEDPLAQIEGCSQSHIPPPPMTSRFAKNRAKEAAVLCLDERCSNGRCLEERIHSFCYCRILQFRKSASNFRSVPTFYMSFIEW